VPARALASRQIHPFHAGRRDSRAVRRAASRAVGVPILLLGAVLTVVAGAGAIEVGDEHDLPPAAESTFGSLGTHATTDGTGRVVVFDGLVDGNPVDATWVFDGTSWSQPCGTGTGTPCGPTARQSYGIATVGGDAVVYGGLTSNFGAPGGVGLGDTWAFNGTTWDEVCDTATCGPGVRTAPAMAADGTRAVLYGGVGPFAMNDMWEFDGTTWTQVCGGALPACGPPGLIGATMLWDGTQFVLFGGTPDFMTGSADTWVLSGSTWTQVCGQGMAPCGPAGRALATSSTLAGGGGLMAGGVLPAGSGAALGAADLWRWDGAAWSEEAVPWDTEPFDFNNEEVVACGPVFTVLAPEGAGARMAGTFTIGGGGPGAHRTSYLVASTVPSPLDRAALCPESVPPTPPTTPTPTTPTPTDPTAPSATPAANLAPTGDPAGGSGRTTLPASGVSIGDAVRVGVSLLLAGLVGYVLFPNHARGKHRRT
jgi:hypothetical protein